MTGPGPMSRNRRVQRLLDAARKHGWEAKQTYLRYSNAPNTLVWTLHPEPNPEGYTLTVYPGENHAATVYADLPGERDWVPVSQRKALALIVEHRAGAQEDER